MCLEQVPARLRHLRPQLVGLDLGRANVVALDVLPMAEPVCFAGDRGEIGAGGVQGDAQPALRIHRGLGHGARVLIDAAAHLHDAAEPLDLPVPLGHGGEEALRIVRDAVDSLALCPVVAPRLAQEGDGATEAGDVHRLPGREVRRKRRTQPRKPLADAPV